MHNITNPKSILYKLIAAFLVPVLCIIVLGVVSYNSAANALTSSYTESMKTAINKTSDYYNLMFSNVKATITDVINNPTMQEYYSGIYEGDSVNEGTIYQNLRSNISSTVMGNSAISNICIIGSYGKTISYSASKLQETGEYNNVKRQKMPVERQLDTLILKKEKIFLTFTKNLCYNLINSTRCLLF